jgi:hypothetical protein
MNDSVSCIQALTAIAQLGIAGATFVLSIVLLVSRRRDARVNYTRMIEESWNQLNALVLANGKLAPLANSVFGVKGDGGVVDDPKLKRYFVFLTLNILQATYLGRKVGLVDEAYQVEGTAHVLDQILRDDEIVDLLHHSGYHPDFVGFCDGRRAGLEASGEAGTKVQRPEKRGG